MVKIKRPLDDDLWEELDLDEKIDAICDAFEEAWKRKQSPIVDDYATLLDESARAKLLRELIILARELQERDYRAKTVAKHDHTLDTDRETKQEVDPGEAANHPFENSLPASLGDYILLKSIGRGSFGNVYLAENTRTGARVAIKIPPPGLIANPNELQRFIREARHAVHLSHPGLVKVHDIEYHDRVPILISEYVDGKNLKDLLADRGPLAPRIAARLVKDLAIGVEYAHQRGIVHRDIKPSNILVEETDDQPSIDEPASIELRPRLLDFGIAKNVSSDTVLTQTGLVLGTPAYMSPEQARGDSNKATTQSDIYSLGVILYELLGGAAPFQGETSAILAQIRDCEVPSLWARNRHVPQDLGIICHKALRLRAEDRYATAAELAADLQRWLASEPIHAKPISLIEKARWQAKRHRWLVASACVVLLVTISAAWLNWRSSTLQKQLVANLMISDAKSHIGKASPSGLESWLVNLPRSLSDHRPLLSAIPHAGPDRLMKIGSALRAHRGASAFLEHCLETCDGDDGIRFRLASLLGLVDDSSFNRWDNSSGYVEWLIENRCFGDVVGWIDLTGSFRTSLFPALQQNYANPASEMHRMTARAWYQGLLQNEPVERSVDGVVHSHPNDLDSWLLLLKQDRAKALLALGHRRSSLTDRFAFDEAGEANVAAYANLLLMEYGLGNNDQLWPHFIIGTDPRLPTYLAHRLPKTAFPVQPLIDRLWSEPNATAQYTILEVLSQLPRHRLALASLAKLEAWLFEMYRSHPDCGVHQMCRSILDAWGKREFIDTTDRQLASEGIVEGRNWYVNQLGMHMRLEAQPVEFLLANGNKVATVIGTYRASPDDLEKHVIPWSFAIGCDEVTVDRYREFLRETSGELPKQMEQASSTDGYLPAVGLTWIEAMQFCEWLSLKMGLPAEGAHVLTRIDENSVEVDYRKTGYRLPTRAEWEYACRVGTVTDCSYGSLSTPGRELFVIDQNESGVYARSSTKLPNVFGLFDTLGNAAEWTTTRLPIGVQVSTIEPWSEIVSLRMAICVCGKQSSTRKSVTSALSHGMPKTRSSPIGLRVAHTVNAGNTGSSVKLPPDTGPKP